MLNVLVVVDHAVGISGPHRNVVGSLNALSARHDVRVSLLCGRIDESEPYAVSGRVSITLGFDPHRPSRALQNIFSLRKVARSCDLIYVPTGLKSLLWTQLARFGKAVIAGPNVSRLPFHPFMPTWRIEHTFLCHLWLEASQHRADIVIQSSGLPERVKVVHHAIDNKKFSPAHRDPKVWEHYGIASESIKILHVGRDNEPRKGVPQLLDAIEVIQALPSARDKIDFIFVGKLSGEIQRRIAQWPNAHCLGFQTGDVLAKLYASADVSVIPSSWENMPFTVLESMASGLAVIAFPVGGIPEQIERDVSGLLVDVPKEGFHSPETGKALAQAILKLVTHSELRAMLGKNARKRIVDYFCEERLGKELSEIFYEVVNAS